MNTTWDIALTFGHQSMRFLAEAETFVDTYKKLRAQEKRENINFWTDDKGWNNVNLKLMGDFDSMRNAYFKAISSAIVFYQVSMEAIINDRIKSNTILSLYQNDNFSGKWTKSLTAVGENLVNIDKYINDIYRPFRNTIIHPEQAKLDAGKLDKLDIDLYPFPKHGIRAGWRAWEQLSKGLGQPHSMQNGQSESWETFCTVNGVDKN